MPQRRDKNNAGTGAPDESTDNSTGAPADQDLPEKNSIVAEVPFTSPKGRTYKIIITDEKDAYEKPACTKKKRERNK